MTPQVIAEHITMTPRVCGGKPCVAGSRIRVQDIVILHVDQDDSLSQILKAFPQLTMADLHAALAYYYDHVDEIRGHMKAADEFAAEMLRTGKMTRFLLEGEDDQASSG